MKGYCDGHCVKESLMIKCPTCFVVPARSTILTAYGKNETQSRNRVKSSTELGFDLNGTTRTHSSRAVLGDAKALSMIIRNNCRSR